jgi:hypothetical protein
LYIVEWYFSLWIQEQEEKKAKLLSRQFSIKAFFRHIIHANMSFLTDWMLDCHFCRKLNDNNQNSTSRYRTKLSWLDNKKISIYWAYETVRIFSLFFFSSCYHAIFQVARNLSFKKFTTFAKKTSAVTPRNHLSRNNHRSTSGLYKRKSIIRP